MEHSGTDFLLKPIKSIFKDTVAEGLYTRYKFYRTELCDLSIPTAVGNVELSVPCQSNLISHVRDRGSYEPALTKDLVECFNQEAVFWDIGGRYGEFSKLAIKCGIPPQNIVTVEGNSYRSRILRHNHENDDIHLISKLVGDGSGDSISINQLGEMYPDPDVVKIDVEGAEYDVIEGSKVVFNQDSPKLYVEVHPQMISSSIEQSIINMLKEMDYNIETVDHRAKDAQWKPFKYANVPSTKEYLIRCTCEEKINANC